MRKQITCALALIFAASPALAAGDMQQRDTTMQQRGNAVEQDFQQGFEMQSQAIAMVQQRLNQLGYDIPVTGDINTATLNATAAFQARQGIEPSGMPDMPTLTAMGFEVEPAGVIAVVPQQ